MSNTHSVMSSTATEFRPFAARSSLEALLDIAAAAALLAGTLALLGEIGPFRQRLGDLDPIAVALAACSTVPLIAWRRFPLGVFVMTAAASVLLAGLGYSIELPLGSIAALYLLAASRDHNEPWTQRTTATVVVLLIMYLGAATAAQGTFSRIALHGGVAWAAAWFAGERTRLRREQIAELEERALRAERDAERERLLAAAEERARIARDLHDSAGHAISVITVRAGAARLRHHQDPDRSLAALVAIEELGRQTAEEIDKIVSTLRRDDSANSSVEAPPGLASLGTLIAQHAAAGLDVTCDVSGTQQRLGAAADQAAYRILQEALMNAARHGAGCARIELAFADAAVELIVTNPVLKGGSPRSGGGHGLIGMTERATLLAGSLNAERSKGVFRVRAWIPYRGRHA